MAIPNSRATLQLYCLRKLGHPVIDIPLDRDQMSDRMDEAFDKFYGEHADSTKRMYIPHDLTDAEIEAGEFELSEAVERIVRVMPISTSSGASSSFFNVQYQTMLSDFWDRSSGQDYSRVDYYMTMLDIAELDRMFRNRNSYEYIKYGNTIRIQSNKSLLTNGTKLVVEAYVRLLEKDYPNIYNDVWLKKYLTALFKQQWGANMKKYDSIPLPGGVTISGQALYDEATQELELLHEELKNKYQDPVDFFMG